MCLCKGGAEQWREIGMGQENWLRTIGTEGQRHERPQEWQVGMEAASRGLCRASPFPTCKGQRALSNCIRTEELRGGLCPWRDRVWE